MSTKSRFNIRLTSLFGRAATGLNGPGWFNASAGGNMRLISSRGLVGQWQRPLLPVNPERSRSVGRWWRRLVRTAVSAVCTCPTSPSDLPVQEEICNIGNSPNSTTKCLILSFIHVFFFFFFYHFFFFFFFFTDYVVSIIPNCITPFA